MAIKVQPSRFAVLRVEDDDDSDESNLKPKQPVGKGGQQSNDLKKKAKKKKKADHTRNETEELRNLALIKGQKKPGQTKGGTLSDSQWEHFQQINDENVDREFEKELNNALLQSRLEYEEKQKAESVPTANSCGETRTEGKKNKKKNKGSAANNDRLPAEELSDKCLKEKISKEPGKELLPSVPDQDVAAPVAEKTSKPNKPQTKMTVEDCKAAIWQKEDEIRELREVNRKIEADLGDVKKKNQQFCMMLGRGEMLDKTALTAELEELRQVRDNLTLQVSQCSSELEKERSKSHVLKAERDKLKGSKYCSK